MDTDPIDVAASSNKYTPITSMVPFNEYMFVNTNADTQYELMGSENQITPFTAQLQPMTFYSTAPLVDPLTLGNNIFFYDAQRLYLCLGRGGSLATAQELSAHCPKYLPTNYGATAMAAAPGHSPVVDADNSQRRLSVHYEVTGEIRLFRMLSTSLTTTEQMFCLCSLGIMKSIWLPGRNRTLH